MRARKIPGELAILKQVSFAASFIYKILSAILVDILNLSTSFREKKRRSRTEIIYNIINLARNGESEYKIRAKVCLSGKQVKSYLGELTKLGLIEMKPLKGRKIYVASQTGSQFLRLYAMLKEFF